MHIILFNLNLYLIGTSNFGIFLWIINCSSLSGKFEMQCLMTYFGKLIDILVIQLIYAIN